MPSLNRTRQPGAKMREESHANHMGGRSWDVSNPVERLRLAAASSFFGEPTYYAGQANKKPAVVTADRRITLSAQEQRHLNTTLGRVSPEGWDGASPREVMERAIDEALDFDVAATLREAARLRQEEHIRTTPQVILVRAAHHPAARGTGLVRQWAPKIIERADEPATQLAYHISAYGKETPIPNSLKKAWRDALSRFSEYELAKYRQDGREVKLVDVVNLVHPAGDAVNKLVRGELKLTGETWEAIISAEGASKASWEKAVPVMGHMALLRNLRNLVQHGVDQKPVATKLVEGAALGKQLPFRYFSAFQALKDTPGVTPILIDAVEQAMIESVGALPQFGGRVMSLADNSGSAWGTTTSELGTMHIAEIANLTAVLTGMASEEGHVGIFGDRLQTFGVRKRASIFDQLERARKLGSGIGGSTEHGIWLFWDQAIREKQHWDTVFVYSDMQAGHGGLYGNAHAYSSYVWPRNMGYGAVHAYIDVPKLVQTYRKQVNPNVQVFLVQVAGYTDTIMPEYFDKTYILSGWSSGLLRFAAAMGAAKTPGTQGGTF
jgi:hypothetical protein